MSKQAERDALYRKAQVIFKEQAPWFTRASFIKRPHFMLFRAAWCPCGAMAGFVAK